MLVEHLHRDTVAKVMRLELGTADEPARDLHQAPDVLARHRRVHQTVATPSPPRSKERRVGPNAIDVLGEHALGVSR